MNDSASDEAPGMSRRGESKRESKATGEKVNENRESSNTTGENLTRNYRESSKRQGRISTGI